MMNETPNGSEKDKDTSLNRVDWIKVVSDIFDGVSM